MTDDKLVIATRGSALALWQANHVKARLEPLAGGRAIELLVIKTSGDRIQDVPLAQVGGKGLFVKEIEQALLEGDADLAVHSMKDVPPELADGLAIAAVSARETPWDALCARDATLTARPTTVGRAAAPEAVRRTIDTLPHGATVGTSSMRRQCQLLARRPDLKIAMLRGNVPTRLQRLDEGKFDAIVLAAAGLTRLGLAQRITQVLPIEVSIPAVTQGVMGVETRAGDAMVRELVVRAVHDTHVAAAVAAERAFLARMGGSCQTPLAAHALDRDDGGMRLVGMVGMPDGTRILRSEIGGAREQAQLMGQKLAEDLLAQGAAEILAATR